MFTLNYDNKSKKYLWVKVFIGAVMESYKLVIPLYHVGEAKQNNKFVIGKEIPESKVEENWAGFGLYFWDNLQNARFWEKSKFSDGKKYTIVKSSLVVDENYILDLTNSDSVNKFTYVLNMIGNFVTLREEAKFEGPLINAAYKFLEEMKSIKDEEINGWFSKWCLTKNFYVIKVIGYYPTESKINHFDVKDRKRPYPTIKSKVIYNVRKQSLLKQRSLYNEED